MTIERPPSAIPYAFDNSKDFHDFLYRAMRALNPNSVLEGRLLTVAHLRPVKRTLGGLEMPDNAVAKYRTEAVVIQTGKDIGPEEAATLLFQGVVFHTHQALPRKQETTDGETLLGTIRREDVVETFDVLNPTPQPKETPQCPSK